MREPARPPGASSPQAPNGKGAAGRAGTHSMTGAPLRQITTVSPASTAATSLEKWVFAS